MFVLKNCFGCLSLRTGGLIIGWLVISILAMLGIFCAALLALTSDGYSISPEFGLIKCEDTNTQDCDAELEIQKVVLGICLAAIMIAILQPILLVVGIFKNSKNCVKMWLVVNFIGLFFLALRFLGCVVQLLWGDLWSTILSIAINVYFHSVVHSFHLQMDAIKYGNV